MCWHYAFKFRTIVVLDVLQRVAISDIKVRNLSNINYIHQAVAVDLIIMLVF